MLVTGLGPVGLAFYVWDIGMKHGDIRLLGIASYAAPVLSTLVAEVYAENDSARLEAAREVMRVFEATPGVVDVDWTVDAPQESRVFRVDRVRAASAGASVEQITRTLYLALSGTNTFAVSHA